MAGDKRLGVCPHASSVLSALGRKQGLPSPGMKEGCSGENVLARER